MASATGRIGISGGRLLSILLLAYILNFVDRQIVGVLAIPIKRDLGLTDTQLGLMNGLAFAILYTGLGIPIAWLADRRSRVAIVSISVALWSLFTAACGLAHGFSQLFLARMGVGIGEAGGVAPSYSLIADSFPPERRARALAIFSFGIPIGSALGLFVGGWIAHFVDWRFSFFVVGGAGLLVAPLIRFGIAEPARAAMGQARAAPFLATLQILVAKPSFWLLSFAAGLGSVMGYGLFAWIPSMLVRSFGMDLIGASSFFSAIVLIGGIAGVWLGGWASDRFGSGRPGTHALVPAFAFLLCVPIFAAGLFAPSLRIAFFLFLVPTALSLAWLGPVIAAFQHIVPPAMRSTSSAGFLFINNMIGIGFGVSFLGFLSDRMKAAYGTESLRYSILYGLGFYVLSAVLYLAASRTLKKDWVGEQENPEQGLDHGWSPSEPF
jgi:MFS family permease